MVCAANMAFANRQVIVHRIREAFQQVFHKDPEALDMHIIYDVCHNIAKVERHSGRRGLAGTSSSTGRGRPGASAPATPTSLPPTGRSASP